MDTHSAVMSRKMHKLPVIDFDPVKLFLKELEVGSGLYLLLGYISSTE